jgi:hypothetical protein
MFENVERAEPLVYIAKLDHCKDLSSTARIVNDRIAYYMNRDILQQTRTHTFPKCLILNRR